MSGINHITGGIIFTGIFTSFWNINIFAKPEYLSLCAFTSILPDIDHTKSPIGKLFYPLSRYLDRNFGHRTITHSLLCFTILLICISVIEKTYTHNSNYSLIFAFSYASHLIFDMMTKEGVPLLYPFNNNPCVIPGNPDRRLQSGNFKTETIIFCLLIPIGISCKSLFENGFWTTFDRTFGNLKNINFEFRESPQLIKLTYEASYLGKKYQWF
jgi:inner membrane protein